MYSRNIHFLVMDVDGTLTDGKIYMGDKGELFKAFDIKDGYGIRHILPKLGIIPVVITARESRIVSNRCKELGISELCQGCHNKFDQLMDIIRSHSKQDCFAYNLSHVAYIGDDLLDLQCIDPIRRQGGFTACPADAVSEVRQSVNHICTHNGGCGAVRELIDLLAQ